MSKYLDLAGLQHYDQKIKEVIEQRFDEAEFNSEQISNIQEAFLNTVTETEFGASSMLSIPNTSDGELNEFSMFGNSTQPPNPTPETPQPIKTTGTSTNVTACGVNFFDDNKTPVASTGLASYTFSDHKFTLFTNNTVASRLVFEIELPLGKSYVLSSKVKVISGSIVGNGLFMVRREPDGGTIFTETTFDGEITTEQSIATTLNASISRPSKVYLWLYPKNFASANGNYTVEFYEVQITEVSKTDFYPYKGSTTPITFRDTNGNLHDLSSLPDGTADSVDVYSGLGVDRISLFKVPPVFSQLTSSTWQREGHFSCYAQPTGFNNVYSALRTRFRCTHFKSAEYEWGGAIFPGNYIALNNVYNIIYIIIENSIVGILPDDTNAQKLAKVNAFFASNDVYLRYRLATPIPWTLHPDERKKIPTYSGHTNIFTDSETPPLLWAKEAQTAAIGKPIVLKNIFDETLNPLTTADLVWDKEQQLTQSALNEKFLQSRTNATTYSQVYLKTATATQSVENLASTVVNGSVAQRTSAGQVKVATAVANDDAVNLKQMQDYVTANTGGGGEVWDDITNLFTANSLAQVYVLFINSGTVFELVGNIPLRITIELAVITPDNDFSITGTIQLYATILATDGINLLTNTIHSINGTPFRGRLSTSNGTIEYYYDVDMPETEGVEFPKILKVERLTGVN